VHIDKGKPTALLFMGRYQEYNAIKKTAKDATTFTHAEESKESGCEIQKRGIVILLVNIKV